MELTLSASSTLTITYGYDPLERLTAADYSDGSFFHYSYDAVGNRLSETTQAESNVYTYDDANRLASANGVAYAWDANDNLLSDEVNSYTYDGANRLTGVTDGVSAVSYAYNGLGDRLQTSAGGQTTRYTLDLVSGLTQVLDDGGYSYLYGNGRIAQYGTSGGEYFLGDALGSVRQLADASGAVRLTRSYQPYGELLASNGDGESVYGFTGEATDALTGMVYLRARWYAPGDGRFTSRDPWRGDYLQPMSYNVWLYVNNNPSNFIDPSGLCLEKDFDGVCDDHPLFEQEYGVRLVEGSGKLDWDKNPLETLAVERAVSKIAQRLSPFTGLLPGLTFKSVFGGIDFVLADLGGYFGWTSGPHKIKVQPGKVFHDPCNNVIIDFKADPLARLFVHELGHAFSSRLDEQYKKIFGLNYSNNTNYRNPEHLLQTEGIYDSNGNFITGAIHGKYRRNNGIDPSTNPDKYPYLGATYFYWRQKGDGYNREKVIIGYQWHSEFMDEAGNTPTEDWADIFMNWVYGRVSFNSNTAGSTIFSWTEDRMQEWVDIAVGKVVR
jgi:RHS repeat-associated protein